jgi:hypothetical protein
VTDSAASVWRMHTNPKGRTQQIAVRLTPAMHAALTAVAEQEDRSLASVVRQACERYLAEHAPDARGQPHGRR